MNLSSPGPIDEPPQSLDADIADVLSTPSSKASRRHSRRVSDRIKSPSDSSDTSDEDLQTSMDTNNNDAAFQRAQSEDIHLQRKVSASMMMSSTSSNGTSGTRRPFPGGSTGYALPATADIPNIPRRTKTLSESSLRRSEDGPLSARMRTEQASPKYGGIGFSKPMSMHHRRRISRDISGHSADDMSSTPDVSAAAKFTRSVSTSSVPSSRGRSESPASPMVDSTSFHAGFKSPPVDLDLADDSYLGTAPTEEPDPFDLNGDRLLPPELRPPRISKLSVGPGIKQG